MKEKEKLSWEDVIHLPVDTHVMLEFGKAYDRGYKGTRIVGKISGFRRPWKEDPYMEVIVLFADFTINGTLYMIHERFLYNDLSVYLID